METRGSVNYHWNIRDQLGQGATGAVFKGRHKVCILNISRSFRPPLNITGYRNSHRFFVFLVFLQGHYSLKLSKTV